MRQPTIKELQKLVDKWYIESDDWDDGDDGRSSGLASCAEELNALIDPPEEKAGVKVGRLVCARCGQNYRQSSGAFIDQLDFHWIELWPHGSDVASYKRQHLCKECTREFCKFMGVDPW